MTNQEYDAVKALLTSIDSAAEISGIPLGVLKNAEKVKTFLQNRINLYNAKHNISSGISEPKQ